MGKRLISILLVVIIVVSMVACGSEESSKEKTLSDRATDAVESHVWSHVYVKYGQPQKIVVNTTYVSEMNSNIFQVSGKVTVTDKYGDKYTGKFTATATYYSATDKFDVKYSVDALYM